MSPNPENIIDANNYSPRNHQCDINPNRIYITSIHRPLTKMVQLIPLSAHAPVNENPTRADIDAYIHGGYGSAVAADLETLHCIVREIECKSGAGALLHPAEEYFVKAVVAAAETASPSCFTL